MHDFKDKRLGIAIPHGIYDMTRNEGWVSVGIDPTRRSSLSPPSVVGGGRWDPVFTRMPKTC